MKISIYAPLSIHEIGQRDNQEDAIAQWDNRLYVLCDGMGGHEHGEVASQTVCQSIVTWFKEHVSPDDLFTDDLLKEAIEYAYTLLDKYADGTPRQMGTTLTLLYVHKQGITAAHMGDSRIYHIRPYSPPELGGVRGGLKSGLLYQSRDHSLAFDLFQSGEITYEEMLNFAQKNVVTRAMTPGEDNRMRPDIIHITDIQPNDYFYLCSDGMLETMNNQIIFSILSDDKTDIEKRKRMIERTKDNQDNHSAWLIHIKNVEKNSDDKTLPNEELTARCNVVVSMPEIASENENCEDDVIIVSDKKKSLFQRIMNIFNG